MPDPSRSRKSPKDKPSLCIVLKMGNPSVSICAKNPRSCTSWTQGCGSKNVPQTSNSFANTRASTSIQTFSISENCWPASKLTSFPSLGENFDHANKLGQRHGEADTESRAGEEAQRSNEGDAAHRIAPSPEAGAGGILARDLTRSFLGTSEWSFVVETGVAPSRTCKFGAKRRATKTAICAVEEAATVGQSPVLCRPFDASGFRGSLYR